MNIEQWKAEYAARLVTRGGMPQAEADSAAKCAANTWLNDAGEDVSLWAPPADAADEEMTYWDDVPENRNGN